MSKPKSLNVIFAVLQCLPSHQYIVSLEIAKRAGYSKSAVEQALACILANGYVDARKGRSGGYKLIVPLDKIILKDLIQYGDKRNPVPFKALQLLSNMTLADFINKDSVI